jgi:FkbM family methyltransferase
LLIPVDELVKVFKVVPNGVLHVGAHLAEEAEMYEKHNWQGGSKIYWVESQSDLAKRLAEELDPSIHQVKCATVWNISGSHLQFNHTNNSQSSSLLDLYKHSEKYPGIKVDRSYEVVTSRLDELFPSANFDFVALDIQGAELKALEGMGDLLDDVKWIYSEVNKIELYKDCALIEDLDFFLSKKGFTRVATRWAWRSGWGDALWVRKEFMVNPILPNLKSKTKNVRLILIYSIRYILGRILVKRA